MFCPQCKYEYRDGFTHCADCDVDLVDTLRASDPRDVTNTGISRAIWSGEREADCVALCRELRDAGIPYNVSQTEASRSLRMAVSWEYRIEVDSADYAEAKDVLQIDYAPESASPADEDAPVSENDSALMDLYTDEEINEGFEPEEDDEKVELAEREAYARAWYPEDATIEIWTQTADTKGNSLNLDETSMIELSLKENLIHFRSELDEKDVRKIFVLPEDEARAREIVREIEDKSPHK